MSESFARGVKGHCQMCGLLLVKHLVECVHKSEYGGCVEPFGCDTRRAYHSIVGTVYERVGVEQE